MENSIVKKEEKKQIIHSPKINGVPLDYVKMMSKYLEGLGWSNVQDSDAWMFYVKCWGGHLNPFADDIYAVFMKDKYGHQHLTTRTAYEVYIDRGSKYLNGKKYDRHVTKFYALGKNITEKAKLTQEEINDLSCQVDFYNREDRLMRSQYPIHISEYKPIYKDKDGNVKKDNFWDVHPRHMLEKCCVVLGLRFLCGKSVSSLGYLEEEMQKSEVESGMVRVKEVKQEPKQEQKTIPVKVSPTEALKKVEQTK